MSKHTHHFMHIPGSAWEVCISCGKGRRRVMLPVLTGQSPPKCLRIASDSPERLIKA